MANKILEKLNKPESVLEFNGSRWTVEKILHDTQQVQLKNVYNESVFTVPVSWIKEGDFIK